MHLLRKNTRNRSHLRTVGEIAMLVLLISGLLASTHFAASAFPATGTRAARPVSALPEVAPATGDTAWRDLYAGRLFYASAGHDYVAGVNAAGSTALVATSASSSESAGIFAEKPPSDDADPICVDGYVINHRELAVDGSKVTLEVQAVGPRRNHWATVGSDGYFKFEDLPEGDYNLRMQLPNGWEGIVPEARRGGIVETGVTSFEASDTCYRIVFKIRRVFDVVVIKWEELLDFTVQPGEGWTITATPVEDPYVKAKTEETDAGGQAYFTLTPGHWVIEETVESGWTPITPKQVDLYLDQYTKGNLQYPVIFKNKEPACHSEIVVWKYGYGTDVSGRSVMLGPLAGWKVTVSRADSAGSPVTQVTDASGKATFKDLPPGVYKVAEEVQAGWEVVGDNPLTVVHMDCEKTDVVFRNREIKGRLMIYGTKWFEAWEPPYKGKLVGLAGWEITARLVGTDIAITVLTDGLGQYRFTEDMLKAAGMAFPGASIEVCEEDRDNWIHKTPECVTVTFPYPVPATYTGEKVDFTNVQDPPLNGTTSSSTSGSGACRSYHKVSGGETLAIIAAKYRTSIGAIAKASGVQNINLVYLGQKLCIP